MSRQFFFYDLETSGLSPRHDRIMQFAGQRTTLDLQPIGDPVNVLVRLDEATLPSPDALLVTGITPQKTIEEGYSEAEFCRLLMEQWFTPETIVVGFNNVRFDDEFIRHILWRNFHDPYAWSWRDDRSRWDLLDVVRMTRALRPEGIEWPFDSDGRSSNRLELLTAANGIAHQDAHDALSDVVALRAVAQLIKQRQPQLFDYLLGLRSKRRVQSLVQLSDPKPVVYVSGRYDATWHKATIVWPISEAPHGNVLVYDLRHDPTQFVGLTEQQLADKVFASWEQRQMPDFVPLPVKPLQYNHCPAVAPVGVLAQQAGWQRLGLDQAIIRRHITLLSQHPEFAERLRTVFGRTRDIPPAVDPEAQLYDGFVSDRDRRYCEAVRQATEQELAGMQPEFADRRLPELLLHYKARNFPRSLSDTERQTWERWRVERVQQALPTYLQRLATLAAQPEHDAYLLTELRLWAERLVE